MDFETLQTVDRDIGLFVAIVRELLSQGIVEEVCNEQLTVGQVRCLCLIMAHEVVTVGDVSRGLGISYPAATKAISRLSEKGLVIRKHDPEDRRNIFVEITPLGQEVTSKVKPEKLKRLGSLLNKMPPKDLKNLRRGIESFLLAAVTDDELFPQICLHCGKEHVENCILSSVKCRKIEGVKDGPG
ncbi:MarR family winged helix-turn-helix transcriptional regulator [Phosphitispora fastidiosa]|uniref:MarR family winged helix-turn-helix transcriptional regulator n=1 Tax=Phosphitispora fastidiosa TaxID=2837202 RepID=UPI001E5E76CD|nr:MarR family winged helix-turn-helix transcriptional regulator [Phosphitispora fastidiosa]MBU7007174.1 DNA-binding MarR family transcriptional regulator [Phosphitispora fastidiosa]